MSEKGKQFRELLKKDGIIIAPGVTTPLLAKLVQKNGFELAYLSGTTLSRMNLYLSDINTVTVEEDLNMLKRINDLINIPLLVDVDTGTGNTLDAFRTSRVYSRLGVGGIIIGDQKKHKNSDDPDNFRSLTVDEMCAKLKALIDGTMDPDMVIVARTDALARGTIEEAIERANAYADAGADMVLVEAPRNLAMMKRIPAEVKVPVLIDLFAHSKTPIVTAAELEDMGYKIAIYNNAPVQAALQGAQNLLQHLKTYGTV